MDLKIALCTIYNDNILDIKEWVEWNKNIGISKIFIYENNINNKKYESINDYISECFVEIINIKSINNEINDLKSNCFIDFYEGQGKDYDWICFLDINDFLMFNDNLDLFSFLNKKEFINQDLILVSLENHNHFVKSIVRSGRQILDKSQDNLRSIFRLENDNTIYSAGLRLRDKRNHYDIPNRIHRLASCYINNRYQAEIKENELKVALCAIAKNENLYIREWVEWYKNLGISKIFLYDNNEIDGERFEEVINDYIESGFVEVIDVRGVEKGCVYDKNGINLQTQCYIECYENKCKNFDWVCFFDVDEFLTFRNNYDLFTFLNDNRFKNFDTILVGWEHYDDNNLLFYENKPVVERFTHISKYNYHGIKSIVRTHKKPININENNVIHTFRVTGNKVIGADYLPYISSNNWFVFKTINNHNCVLNHYKTKTADEYIKRHLGRHWGTGIANTKNPKSIEQCINEFFKYNEKNPKKLSLFYRKKSKKILNNDIIITLTSWKGRINNIYNTLLSILNNTITPYKIILNLAIEEFKNKENDLPENIIKLTKEHNNFEIFWVEKNTFVFKKLIPTINRYKDNYIITIDDDILYPIDFISNILSEYEKYDYNMPMSFGGKQSDWKIGYNYIYSHYGAGSIVKYQFFDKYLDELYQNVVIPALNNNIKMFDDVLYTYAALLNGYKYIRNLNYSIRNYVLNSPKLDKGFSNENNKQHELDTQKCHQLFINYIINTYNISLDDLINNASTNGGIIVNMTTWLKRDWCVEKMLTHFKNQTLQPHEIILWLSYDEYNGIIPNHLLKCLNDRLLTSIRFVNGNTYGHKRYETFKINNNCYNILVDDDILYWNTYVEELFNACKTYPYHAITYCSTEIEYIDTSRKLIPIKDFNISNKNIYMSGLSAFGPQTFPVEMFNFVETRDKYSTKCDDSWVRAWLLKINIPMLVLHNRDDYKWNEIENTQSVGIWETFNKIKQNGILQVIKNFSNSIVSINGEDIIKNIWPKFNIKKCIGYIQKANISKIKNSLNYIPYIYNGKIINTERLKSAIITNGINKGNFLNMDLNNPKLIYEKIQYLKIYDNLELKAFCSDKILVHEYCKQKLGKDICIPIIKIYDSPNEIKLEELPDKFVLKCNHGYKMNIICQDKNKFDLNNSINKCNLWLNTDFGLNTMQFHYSLINKKCFIEKYMTNGSVGLTDYKFWCQNGIPYFIMVINDRYNGKDKMHANIYDLDWNQYDLGWDSHKPNYNLIDKKPKTLNLMIKYAKKLSEDFKFVRVDFYEIDGNCYLGELTFTPDNGFFHFTKENEIKFGNLLNI